MVRKPVSVLIAMGQIVACTITTMIAVGVRPNQIIASGKMAIDGRGLRIEESTLSASCPSCENTATEAKAKPSSIPITIPITRFCSVASVAATNCPLARSVPSAFATLGGADTSIGGTPLTTT